MSHFHQTDIRSYSEEYWDQVHDFLKQNWRKDHPILYHDLFEWQYKGFGNNNKKINSKVLFHNEEVIGFLGVIPGIYQVPTNGGMLLQQGGSLNMWILRKDFRGKGLGSFQLHLEARRNAPVTVVTGANLEVTPFYLSNSFSLVYLNRYVIPLDAKGYQSLLIQEVDLIKIKEWVRQLEEGNYTAEMIKPDIGKIAKVWEETTFLLKLFSLYRNKEFWKWRYIDSPRFNYKFFGVIEDTGIVIARVERIYSEEKEELHGKKVLRIIEMLPKKFKVWKGQIDRDFVKLVRGVLKWGQKEGCLAADFQCTTKRLEPVLDTIGFKKQNIDYGPPLCSLAGLFQPFKHKPLPINALWRINIEGRKINISPNNTYIVKSENDSDRVNIWPLPRGFV